MKHPFLIALRVCRPSIACLCVLALYTHLLAPESKATTGCNAYLSAAPNNGPSYGGTMNCGGSPCLKPSACKVTWTGSWLTTWSATYNNCGPLVQCILQGEDPPVSNSVWNEGDKKGSEALGSSMLSGKCAPPLQDSTCQPSVGTACQPQPDCPPSPLGLLR